MKKWMLAVCILLVVQNVCASGFSMPPFPKKEMHLFKGQSETFPIILQNGENRTYVMSFEIVRGKNISTIIQRNESRCEVDKNNPFRCTVLMPPFTYDGRLFLQIDPSGMNIGDRQDVNFAVLSVDPEAGGMITFNTQVGGGFTVVIDENPNAFKLKAWHVISLIAIILMIGVGGFVGWRAYKRKKDEQKKSQDPLHGYL